GNKESVDTYPVKAENDWKLTINQLPAFDNEGKAYTYEIEEIDVDSYESTINGFNITNLRVGTTEVSVTKTWQGDEDAERPELIKVHLLQNGKKFATQEVTAEDNWTYNFENLPEFDKNGAAYTY